MKTKREAQCPCCGSKVEYFPEQDGSVDWYCTHCSWHNHVPGDREIACVRKNRKTFPRRR